MRCADFETRLNEVLDERGSVEVDPQLSAHAQNCPDCSGLLAGCSALLDGLDARMTPQPPVELADRVLKQSASSRDTWSGRLLAICVAVAAGLLIALLPKLFYPTGPGSQPMAEDTPVDIDVTPPGTDSDVAPPADTPTPPPSGPSLANQLPYAEMVRYTGQTMAQFPNTVRNTQTPEGLRPVTSSMAVAFDAVRRTLPGTGNTES